MAIKFFSVKYNFFFRRISVIFRVRSAKAIKITDASLIKKLSLLCGFVSVALLIRTLVSPPDVIVGRTADNLKAFLCKTDWWDHTFTSSKICTHKKFKISRLKNFIDFFFLFLFVHSGSTISRLGCSLMYCGTKSSIWIQRESLYINGNLQRISPDMLPQCFHVSFLIHLLFKLCMIFFFLLVISFLHNFIFFSLSMTWQCVKAQGKLE